jgi:hypothetical protein
MSSLIADLCDAMVTSLNGASLSQTFTAQRLYQVRYTESELSTLRVSVTPGPAQWNTVARDVDDRQVDVDVAVQKKLPAQYDNDDVDALLVLVEEIVEHFRQAALSAGSINVICMERALVPGADSAVAREHLEDHRAFTGVIRTTWRARQ